MKYQSVRIHLIAISLITLFLSSNIFASRKINYEDAKNFINGIAQNFDMNLETMEKMFGQNENTYIDLFKTAVEKNDTVIQSALVAVFAHLFMYKNEQNEQLRLLKIFQAMLESREFIAYKTIYRKAFPDEQLSNCNLISKAQSMYTSANEKKACWADIALNLGDINIHVFENEEELNTFLEQS